MLSVFHKPWALAALYAGNAMWHTSAVIHFGFRPAFMMGKLSLRGQSGEAAVAATPAGDAWHHDLMAYLAGMNSPLALLALARLWGTLAAGGKVVTAGRRFLSTGSAAGDVPLDLLALLALAAANASQMGLNYTVGRGSRRWICGWHLDRITVLDTVFTVLDTAAAAAKFALLL